MRVAGANIGRGREESSAARLTAKAWNFGAPMGNRTPVFAVRGRRPRPLDDGGGPRVIYSRAGRVGQVGRSIVPGNGEWGEACRVREVVGLQRKHVRSAGGDHIEEAALVGFGAIGGGGCGIAIRV